MSAPSRFYPSLCLIGMLLVLVGTWNNRAAAHQFEDGYVERTVAVRVRDQVGKIEYSIGLNDATMEQFRHRWPDDRELYEKFQQDSSNRQSSHQPSTGTTTPVPQQPSPELASGLPTDKDLNLPEDGTLVNEIKLIEAFAKVAAPHLQSGIRVSVNSSPIILKLVSAAPSPRHHATLDIIWKFELTDAPLIDLSVRDTNFLRQPGGIKYSLKTSGTSMTLRSNVAPILIRSTRIGLDVTSVKNRLLAPGIEARIRVLQPADMTP